MDWGLVEIIMIIIVPVLVVFGAQHFINFIKIKKDKQEGARFTNRIEITILICGLLLLLVLIVWIRKTFFG